MTCPALLPAAAAPVPADGRQRVNAVLAVLAVDVAVADGAGGHAQLHLSPARGVELQVFQHEGLVVLVKNGAFHGASLLQ